MALNNPVDGQSIKEYDTLQTDEINKIGKVDTHTITNPIGWDCNLLLTKRGTFISIEGIIRRTSSDVAQGKIIANIPIAFRPNYSVPVLCAKGNINPFDSAPYFWLLPSGDLVIRSTLPIPADANVGLNINMVYSGGR